MRYKPIIFSVLISMLLLAAPVTLKAAEKATMAADNISYNINTKKAKASGNVVITKEGATLWGDAADGNIETSEFNLRGNVKGKFPQKKAELAADSLKWKKASNDKNGIVEAFVNVRLTRGTADRLSAQYVRWESDTENYQARGRVDGATADKLVKAEEIGRLNGKFWGRKVTRYEDKIRKISFAADVVDGELRGDLIKEVIASGSVVIEYIDKAGLKTVVKGNKAVYSKDRGTVVISGNASAVRSDGKVVTADSLVLYEETKNIEAIGRSKLTFDMPSNKDKEKNNDKPAAKSEDGR